MFYRTVGVSRRVVRVKSASKTGPKRTQHRVDGPGPQTGNPQHSTFLPFEMQSASPFQELVHLESRRPSDWKAVFAFVCIVLATLAIGIYFARNGDSLADGRVRQAPAIAKRDFSQDTFVTGRTDRSGSTGRSSVATDGMPLNLHPMGYAGSERHSTGLPVRVASVRGHSGSGVGQSVYPGSTAEEVNEALNSGDLKLVLPAEVSGKCDIGGNGLADLGSCLARVGVRVERP